MEITLQYKNGEKGLIEACIRQEHWAQKALYEEHYSNMMGVCLRYSNDENDALDILHDGFIKVFSNISKYKVGTSLHSWIRRIMVNTAIDYYRKKIRRRTDDIESAYYIASAEPSAVARCSEKEILQAVQSLSPSYRLVFNLYVIEGYSHKEIAQLLNITESTSRSNLVKARQKLQSILKAELNIYE